MNNITQHNGEALTVENGQVAPFLPRKKSALVFVQGTGTLTLHYSLDGEHWSQDDTTFDITDAGSINIETYFMVQSFYKITSTGSIIASRIRYE